MIVKLNLSTICAYCPINLINGRIFYRTGKYDLEILLKLTTFQAWDQIQIAPARDALCV